MPKKEISRRISNLSQDDKRYSSHVNKNKDKGWNKSVMEEPKVWACCRSNNSQLEIYVSPNSVISRKLMEKEYVRSSGIK